MFLGAGFGDQRLVIQVGWQGDGTTQCANHGEQLLGRGRLVEMSGGFLRMVMQKFIPRLPDDADG